MHWNVIKVKPVAPFALSVQFADGTVETVQFFKVTSMGSLPP